MPVPYMKHGRRHASDGEDPIPGVGSTPAMYPTEYQIMYPFAAAYNGSGFSSGFAPTDNLGVNSYNQYYIQATALNDYFCRIVRLGPAGSVWGFQAVMRKGSDGGQLTLSIAQLSEDNAYGVNGNGGASNGIGALEDIDDTPATFYDLLRDPSPSTPTADCYAAGTTEYQLFNGPDWMFRLNGADGDTLSAITSSSDGTHNQLDSGSGMYAIKLKTTGKNASSSGYRIRMHYFELRRLTGSLLTT